MTLNVFDPAAVPHFCKPPASVKLTNNLSFFFFILVLVIFFYTTKDVESTRFKDGRRFIILNDAVYSQRVEPLF